MPNFWQLGIMSIDKIHEFPCPKIYLILYPSLENLTTHIAINENMKKKYKPKYIHSLDLIAPLTIPRPTYSAPFFRPSETCSEYSRHSSYCLRSWSPLVKFCKIISNSCFSTSRMSLGKISPIALPENYHYYITNDSMITIMAHWEILRQSLFHQTFFDLLWAIGHKKRE